MQQPAGPALQFVGNRDVLLTVPDHLDHAGFQTLDFFAQHAGLAFLQADRTVAVAAGQLHRGQQGGVALEKVGRVGQKVGNVVFGDGMFGGVHGGIVLGLGMARKTLRYYFNSCLRTYSGG